MFAKIFQAITYWPIYLALKFFVRYEVDGQENLKGLENSAVIFASNHTSLIDGPICAAAMPRNGSWYPKNFFPVRFLAIDKAYPWFFGNIIPFPLSIFTSAYVRINGSIKIFRTGGDLEKSLTHAIKAINSNYKIWIYPEGKITKDGNLQPGKRGAAFLHQQTKAAVVPVALIGTFGILSLKALFCQRRVKVKIGKPLFSLSGTLEQTTDQIMKEIGKLSYPQV